MKRFRAFYFGTLLRGKPIGYTIAAMIFWPLLIIWRPVDWRPVSIHVVIGLALFLSVDSLGTWGAAAGVTFVAWKFLYPLIHLRIAKKYYSEVVEAYELAHSEGGGL